MADQPSCYRDSNSVTLTTEATSAVDGRKPVSTFSDDQNDESDKTEMRAPLLKESDL